MDSKLKSYIGLCKKAGNVCAGEFQVVESIRKSKAKIVFVATDTSDNTKKKISDKCAYYHTPIIFYATKEEFGYVLGQAPKSCISITDINFYNAIKMRLEEIITL